MSSSTLPLSIIVDVVVQVSPQLPAIPSFNEGLIIGNSGVIPSTGANSRIRSYVSLTAMLTDGFTISDPEYIAASIYFSQVPAASVVWIGCQDPAGLNVIAVGSSGGTGYQVGDVLTVVQGAASGGTVQVTTVNSGVVTGVVLVTSGTGYSIATGLTTTGGHGTGALINITSIGEPPLQAVTACRAASSKWYAFMVATSTDTDQLALALFAQSANPPTVYFFNTADVAVLNNTAGNVFATMKAANYNRTFGMYSTTQGSLAPNNAYISAAAMGVAMGLNTGLANSYYTMKFKTLVGAIVEPLTLTQISNIEGNNGNLYLSYGNAYTILEQGTVMNGQFFDEIINLDMLTAAIQINVMNLLVSNPSIPQTDPGETQLIHSVNQACETSRLIGFIASGTWEGVPIINLKQGDTLPNGYLSQAFPYATQSPADRLARKAMPIYTAIIEAGSTHSLTVAVIVQR